VGSITTLLSSAKPFECCIKEYGVLKKKRQKSSNATHDEDSGGYEEGTWLRRFRMFGTTISAF